MKMGGVIHAKVVALHMICCSLIRAYNPTGALEAYADLQFELVALRSHED